MKRIVTAAIAVAGLSLAGAAPARATTFPALTTIYFASGVVDTHPTVEGIATVVNCSNMSGQTASVRYQFRRKDGTIAAGGTLLLANFATHVITSAGIVGFYADPIALPTGGIYGGALQILSTQSAVYCSAMLVRADGTFSGPSGVALHMVRFNPHPGTVE